MLLALEFALLSAFDFGNLAGDGIVFLRYVEGFLFEFSQFAACLAGSLFVGLGFADFADGIFNFGIGFLEQGFGFLLRLCHHRFSLRLK